MDEKLKEAREAEKESGDGDFNRPFLKLVFKKTGELKYWSAARREARRSAGAVAAQPENSSDKTVA